MQASNGELLNECKGLETNKEEAQRPRWRALLFVGLSLSIGWGIRGNFGHEWGAAIPGALAAMAAVLLSGREDWLRRAPYFALFGAIGWAFGGTMAYMVVIAYTHSGHSSSVLYGFACLFVLGFLWAAAGGAVTALPAYLTRERLAEFFPPIVGVFLVWWLGCYLVDHARAEAWPISPLEFYLCDSYGLSALLVIALFLFRGAFRWRLDWAERLILSMAVGWLVGYHVLFHLFGLDMAPGKGGGWAGMTGLTAALLLFLYRHGLRGVVLSGVACGLIGGLAFMGADLLKLIEVKSGLSTNWHSILEQTYGLFNGFGLAVAIELLRRRAPRVVDSPPTARWTEGAAVAGVLLLLTYVNLNKEVQDWVGSNAMPAQMYFLTARGWFDLFYLLTAVAFLWLLREHMRRPLPIVPVGWLGKTQMIYLMLLWWMVIGNFTKALVGFAPERLVTEGTIVVNALICTVMALCWTRDIAPPKLSEAADVGALLKRVVVVMALAVVIASTVSWAVVRAIWGDKPAGYSGNHVRFGPDADHVGKDD